MKIGIISSRNYQTDVKVLNHVFYHIKEYIGIKNCIVASAANDGMDEVIRNYAIDNNIEYVEFNPSYTGHNQYSFEFKQYYGKGYHISHLYDRYQKLFRYCDKLLIFKQKKDTDEIFMNSIETLVKKPIKNLKYVIYEQ